METNRIHTDLALELQEGLSGGTRPAGISVQERFFQNKKIKETVITVENEEGERQLGKPRGIYITLEDQELQKNDGRFHEQMSELLYVHLRHLLKDRQRILVAGLGNRQVTPDALGPLVVEHLYVNGHLRQDANLQSAAPGKRIFALAPGVMAQTGMETGRLLQGVIREQKPDALLAVDALAAKSLTRLNTTIQICDTGIRPGAGVGNQRQEISRVTMEIPVIAVGVPTVISMPALASEIAASFVYCMGKEKFKKEIARWSESAWYRHCADMLGKEMYGLCVTPKEVDESVLRISYTVSEAINRLSGTL